MDQGCASGGRCCYLGSKRLSRKMNQEACWRRKGKQAVSEGGAPVLLSALPRGWLAPLLCSVKWEIKASSQMFHIRLCSDSVLTTVMWTSLVQLSCSGRRTHWVWVKCTETCGWGRTVQYLPTQTLYWTFQGHSRRGCCQLCDLENWAAPMVKWTNRCEVCKLSTDTWHELSKCWLLIWEPREDRIKKVWEDQTSERKYLNLRCGKKKKR